MERKSRRGYQEYEPQKRLKNLSDIIDHIQKYPLSITLPNDVIDHIISLLPIKEATQTSILCKRFEKSWQHCNDFCFDFNFSKKYSQIQVASIIHRVLMLHSSTNIKSFHLCINSDNLDALIVTWIELVLSKNPKVLDLDFCLGKPRVPCFEVPFDLLDIESIEYLRFSYCQLNIPSKFKGLHFLRTLVLRHINLKSCMLKTIIDNCSLLECLDIVKCHIVHHLEVDASALKFFKVLKIGECYQLDLVYIIAPTLSVFHFVGKPQRMVFGGRMEELKDVQLYFKFVSYLFPRHKMKDLIRNISRVRVLTITSTLLEDLCSTVVHGETIIGPKYYLWHLKEVKLLMETSSFCNPYDIVNFVDKCPLLERLFIDLQKYTFDERSPFWMMHDNAKFEQYDKQIPFLKLLKISNFNFHALELKLVKFFLEKAMNLEYLAIFTAKNCRTKKSFPVPNDFSPHLMTWRSSTKAKVSVYKYCDRENNVLVPEHSDLWY